MNTKSFRSIRSQSVSTSTELVLSIFSLMFLTLILIQPTTAQDTLNGVTPSGLAPGSPAGSYALSGFETINPFNGGLNFDLPLVKVGGRGRAATSADLRIEQKWTIGRYEDPTTLAITNWPEYNWWSTNPTYLGARAQARTGGNVTSLCASLIFGDRQVYPKTLTRITISMADGTEMQLRDTFYGGEPKNVTRNGQGCPISPYNNRGKIFVTTDGSSATFISDGDIVDTPYPEDDPVDLSGTLYLKDGTQLRFDYGWITYIKDRNGNKLTYSYGFSGSSFVTQVTDSLNRQVTSTLNYTDGTYGLCDKITYKGFGGASRTIFITKASLSSVFRSGYSSKTYAQLFPSLNGTSGGCPSCPAGTFNPTVNSAVYLPNGKSYQFKYNSFGELASVTLPTGGVIEYDWGAGDYSTESDGGIVPTTKYMDYGVYRRVIERRLYPDGSTLDRKEIYERPSEINSGEKSSAVVETKDGSNNLLAKQKTYFWGSAKYSFLMEALDYGKWREGKVYQDDSYDFNGSTVLRRTENTYAQKTASFPFNWWSGSSDDAPDYDSRTTETKSTLSDTSQVSKQTFDYDQYNNVTDVYEYDYGSSTPGSFVRRSHTDFLTTNSVNSTDYANPAPIPSPSASPSPTPTPGTIHIRNLPSETWVSSDSGGSTKLSKTTFEYDDYGSGTGHAGLVNRSSISGHDTTNYSTSYTKRGNATAVTRWLNLSGSPTGVTSYQQYDIAGNVVLVRDPRGCETSAAYSDSFGAPDGNATTNTSPSELSGVSQTGYAFATTVTNCLSQSVYSQFDFYTGMPVDGVDLNGVATSGYSTSDSLDRPTQIIRAVGQTEQSQTTFAYDDTNKKVTTTSDLATYNDNALKTESYYDGLGRTTETRRYDGASTYIKTTQTYDAVGRIKRSYNPHRTTSASTDGYAENTYDALGRVTAVTTSDSAVVTTAYSGNTITVTDQASKQRKSVTDALGRLKIVYEPDSGGTLNVNTDYTYDVLNNLLTVSQGSQARTFVYDNLSRLTSAANPESGTTTYVYDGNGNLTKKTDARNVETNYVYDGLNRVTQRSYATPSPTPNPSQYQSTSTVNYTYDNVTNGIGKLTKVANGSSETWYTSFDKMGRVTGHKQVTNSWDHPTTYTYNLAGMLLVETYPSGRAVKNTIGSYGDLSQVETKESSGSYVSRASNFTFSAPGAVSAMQLGNSLWEGMDFNARLQPTEIKLGTSSGAYDKLRLQYTYGSTDNNGNVLTQTITVPSGFTATQTYTYDSLNRIATAAEVISGSTTWSQTFGYDRYGNRNITAGTGYSTHTFSSSTNKITSGTFAYDAAGNTLTDGNSKTFVYDGENKQTSVSNGGTLGTYGYDGDGKRVTKDASTGDDRIFLYDATGKLIEETDLSHAVQTSYVFAGSRLLSTETTGNAPSYLTADMLGTPRINTDGSGNVTARHDYMPFGEEIFTALTAQRTPGVGYPGTDGIRKQFTGYERDTESALEFAQARYYSTSIARFSTPDDLLNDSSSSDPQSWNKYVYVRNTPLNLIDPGGKKAKIYITTDKKTKQGTIVISASFGVYSQQGGLSEAELKEQAALLEEQIEETFKGGFVIDGITYSVSASVTAQVFNSESDAAAAGQKGEIDNIVGVRSDIDFSTGTTRAVGMGYNIANQDYDRMVVAIGLGKNGLNKRNSYAHEFGHLLGVGHLRENAYSEGLMRGGQETDSRGRYLASWDAGLLLAAPARKHVVGTGGPFSNLSKSAFGQNPYPSTTTQVVRAQTINRPTIGR